MDNQNSNVEEQTASALQVNELFLRKILTRDPSMDNSVPYRRRSVAEVPFRWELRPGTPRHHVVARDEIVPPIRPPPASPGNSQDHKPCSNMSRETRAGFWKKFKKNSEGNKKAKGKSDQGDFHHHDEFYYYRSSSASTNSRSSSSTSSHGASSRMRSLAKALVKWAN